LAQELSGDSPKMRVTMTFRFLALAIAASLALAPLQSSAALSNSGSAPVGTGAPTVVGQSLDGTAIRSSDLRGKVVVLNFWATWCPPCRAETADMIRGYGALHGDDVAFLGVDTTENAAVVKTFVSINGIPYPTAIAAPSTLNAFGVEALPTTIVIDAKGVVRARWIGEMGTARLRSYVVAARRGSNANYSTPEQLKIDSMLALAQFSFSGSPAHVSAVVARANKALNDVTAYTAKLNAATTPRYDYERTEHEQGALELPTALSVARAAKTSDEKTAAAKLVGGAYGDLNRWSDAANTYRAVLAKHPRDLTFTGLLAYSYYRLHDYGSQAGSARAWTALAPNDADAWDSLGLANERLGQFAQAAPAYERAVRLLRKTADRTPVGKTGQADVAVADESLDLADVYVALGDVANAKRVFALSARYAAMIPSGSPFSAFPARVADRTLEGMTAVGLGHSDATTLSLTKWTGPDLPGSVVSTLKYRLVVVAPANKQVTLAARGLRPGWIASFCSDRLCSPNHVSFAVPPTGVKTYEFQLIPPTPGVAAGKVFVGAQGDRWVAVP
jgi:thiol-disulfide isomerase/thioredoxin